jgi:hypothetical protein
MKNQISLFFKAMLVCFVTLTCIHTLSAQDEKEIEKQLQDFFFGLSFYVDIDVIRTELNATPEFKAYQDSNRDEKKSIVGTMTKNKNLNPLTTGNQFIVLYSGGAKRKKVSFKWSINYKYEDLPSASVDFESLQTRFKPLFSEAIEKFEVGQQREQVKSLTLKEGSKTLVIKLLQFNNYIHTVSIEYKDKWKITPIDILKVKY